jgi:hypothetical protein
MGFFDKLTEKRVYVPVSYVRKDKIKYIPEGTVMREIDNTGNLYFDIKEELWDEKARKGVWGKNYNGFESPEASDAYSEATRKFNEGYMNKHAFEAGINQFIKEASLLSTMGKAISAGTKTLSGNPFSAAAKKKTLMSRAGDAFSSGAKSLAPRKPFNSVGKKALNLRAGKPASRKDPMGLGKALPSTPASEKFRKSILGTRKDPMGIL